MVRWSEKPLRRFAYLTAALLVGWTGPRPVPAPNRHHRARFEVSRG